MNYKVSGEVRLSYLPFLRERFFNQLQVSEDEDRNTVAIELMDDYGLDREDVFENLDEFKMDSKAPKIADVDSKAKAAFTREYNNTSHKSQALVDEQGVPAKKKRNGGNGSNGDLEDPDAINDDIVEEEEEDDDDDEDLEKVLAAFKKKGRKSASKSTGKSTIKAKSTSKAKGKGGKK
jgi:replication factor C subunit 1